MSSAIVVDYEELTRLSAVWAAAAQTLFRLAAGVAELGADPAIGLNAIFDPIGAVRAEARIAEAVVGPHGLGILAARLACDAITLDAVIAKEKLVDDLPVRQLVGVQAWLASASFRFAFAPMQTLREGEHRIGELADASVGYLAPFTEDTLRLLAPSLQFRADMAARRAVSVDPIFGLPLKDVELVAPEGPGSVANSTLQPAWQHDPPASIASMVDRIGDLEAAPEASLAIQAVAGSDGRCRYVVELPGIRDFAASGTPQDLAGAVSAMAFTVTGYTRCVRQALDAVAVPLGAEVLLVGHSQGGIVAMDLAGDPAFNGGRVRVTHVVAAGAPISSKDVAERSGTRVFSVENVNDVVTHLDAVDSVAGRPAPDRLVYQFARNEHHTVASHSARLYARQLAALSDSPNPRWRDFHESVRPYLAGTTTTTVFTLRDRPAS